MDDPLILPTVSATRNRLADLMTSIGQGAGKAVDWLAGGAHVGAEPTLALMRGDALDQPFLPTADSGGRIGAIASALGSTLMPVGAPAGALGAGPVVRTAEAALDMSPEARAARAAEQGYTVDAYKGHAVDFPHFDNPDRPYAGFFSDDPQVASRFAEGYAGSYQGAEGASDGIVYPTKLRMQNPYIIDAQGQKAGMLQFGRSDLAREYEAAINSPDHDGVILRNTADEGEVYIPKTPQQIRSRFAAFDPARSGESDLLASRAGVPAVPQQPAPQPEDPATTAARASWIQEHLARGGM
jgi:hypothetical protein